MSTNLITILPETTLAEVREIFLTRKVHHLPVLEGRKLIGLVTSWDLFKLGKSSESLSAIPVSEVMTKRLATLQPEDKIGAAAEVLLEHLFHALPIVNDEHELVGMLTSYDLLKYEFGKEYSDERKEAEMLTGYH
jgi:CBS domain-containing protein